jgi:quinol monooxygenase YgiN
MTQVALWVHMQAKEGKEAEVEEFLNQGQGLVEQEPDTTAWFAVKLGGSAYGIFDAFPSDEGRQAHLNGKVAEALMARADELLAEPPKIEQIDVLADKLPG